MKLSFAALLATALLAACAPDRAVAPEDIASPLFLLGTSPTNGLLGGPPTLTHSAVDGMVRVELGINRGIYNASRNSDADFRLQTQLTFTNDAGQRIIDGGECPVADLKVEFIDDASQLVVVSFSIPWDGNDANGEPMGGTVMASYSFQLLHAAGGQLVDPKVDLRAVGNPVTGSVAVSLGTGTQLQ